MVLWIVEIGTPRVPAFSQSTSMRYSGVSFIAVGPHGHQARVFGRHAQKLVAGRHEGLVAQAAAVLEFEVEPLGVAELHHGRRGEGEGKPLAEGRKVAHGPSGHRIDLQVRTLAQIPVLELDKRDPHILTATGMADPRDGETGSHRLFLFFQHVFADLVP